MVDIAEVLAGAEECKEDLQVLEELQMLEKLAVGCGSLLQNGLLIRRATPKIGRSSFRCSEHVLLCARLYETCDATQEGRTHAGYGSVSGVNRH